MSDKIITNLSDKELSVIKAVDALGNASVLQIAKKSGIRRTTIYNFIDKLVDNNLIGVDIINGARRYFEPNQNISILEAKNTGHAQKIANFSVLTSFNSTLREAKRLLKHAHLYCIIGSSLVSNKKRVPTLHKFLDEISQSGTDTKVLFLDQTQQFITPNICNANCRNYQGLSGDTSYFFTHKQALIYSSDKGGVGYKISDPLFCESLLAMFDIFWQKAE